MRRSRTRPALTAAALAVGLALVAPPAAAGGWPPPVPTGGGDAPASAVGHAPAPAVGHAPASAVGHAPAPAGGGPAPAPAGSTTAGGLAGRPDRHAGYTAPFRGTYTNPISAGMADTFADPAIIRGKDGYWYAYGTTDPLLEGEGTRHLLPISRSTDLVTWEHV